MARTRIGLGTHPLIENGHWRGQPTFNLSIGRSLDHSLRYLDGVARRRRDAYADAWIDECRDANIDIRAEHKCDGELVIRIGIPADGQEKERFRRQRALADHLGSIEGAHAQVIEQCRRRGLYDDNRSIATDELIRIVRRFVSTGGRLLVSPRGRPLFKSDNNLIFASDPKTDLRAAAHLAAALEAEPLKNRWRAHDRLARIGRRIGDLDETGWHVLAAKAPAEQVPA